MNSNSLTTWWANLPAGRRLALLALATVFAAVLAVISLLSQFNVNAILYKGF